MSADSVEPHPDPPTRVPITIAALVLIIAVLSIMCGSLWVQSHDAALRAEIDARIEIREAETKSARAIQEAKALRQRLEQLQKELEVSSNE
ncbi:MAG: hypothetical protein AB8G99_24040 [Planctomycetaceae bacterium]